MQRIAGAMFLYFLAFLGGVLTIVSACILVLGSGKDGKAVRFRVRIDGTSPGEDHGGDADEKGEGVREYRLYQLVRPKGKVEDLTFEIEFLDPGVQDYAFTFG
jgi:hypothetical protein